MKCAGIDIATGQETLVSFHSYVEAVDELVVPSGESSYLSPGWIDLQVNGYAGVDFSSPEAPASEIARAIRAIAASGTTRFFPTVITSPEERMAAALANLARAKRSTAEGAAMEGFHLEGPFISPEDGPRGAHPKEYVRPPDLSEFERLQDAAEGNIRLITLAPEWREAPRFIERVVGTGIVVAIGHTQASASQLRAAVSAGASLSTHLGNAAHPVLPRRSNYLWDQLAEDRLAASFIVDDFHLDAAFLKCALRSKGVERSVLVTDAAMPAGCAPGAYRLGEVEVELHSDGSVRIAGGERLAGSALRMDQAISNIMRIAGLTLREAVALASRNPARIGRIAGRQRGLVPGERADLVRFQFDPELQRVEVLETWTGGEQLYAKPA